MKNKQHEVISSMKEQGISIKERITRSRKWSDPNQSRNATWESVVKNHPLIFEERECRLEKAGCCIYFSGNLCSFTGHLSQVVWSLLL